ncbi:MAG: DUF4339 domain-containing protein [Polyangiaceae bacterium]
MAGSGDKWRWADSEGVQRVVSTDELRAAIANGVLPATTLVWRAGMPKWQRASEVSELASAPSSALRGTIVGIPPPPASMVAVQAAYEQGPGSSASGAKPSSGGANLKSTQLGLGGAAVAAVALGFVSTDAGEGVAVDAGPAAAGGAPLLRFSPGGTLFFLGSAETMVPGSAPFLLASATTAAAAPPNPSWVDFRFTPGELAFDALAGPGVCS